jgi:hypothetical protein
MIRLPSTRLIHWRNMPGMWGWYIKELWIVTGQTNIGQPWEDRAQKGFILRQYAIDYGKE